MAIKFTAKDDAAADKPRSSPAKTPAVEPKNAATPDAETELFPAAPKTPGKKRKSRFS